MMVTPGIYCPTVLKIELVFKVQKTGNRAEVGYKTMRSLSPLDSAGKIPQGFPSLQLFLIVHNLVAFGFITAILACVCQSLYYDSCVLRTSSDHYLELVFHQHGEVLNFVEVITLLSHEQHGRECAVQLSCPRLVTVSTCSKISLSLQIILTHCLLTVLTSSTVSVLVGYVF